MRHLLFPLAAGRLPIVAVRVVAMSAIVFVACDDDASGDPDAAGPTPVADAIPAHDAALPDDVGSPPDSGTTPDAHTDASNQPECPADTNYGLTGAPRALTSGPTASHSPRAVWTGSEWGVVWLSEVEGGAGNVRFLRVDRDGVVLSDPVVLGRANSPKFRLAYTGSGYATVWLSSRSETSGFEGLRVQMIDAEGSPDGQPSDLNETFDVDGVDLAWARLQSGMLVYSRGQQNGEGGLYAVPIDDHGVHGDPVQLWAQTARNPAVAFGNGTWGVAWMTDHGSSVPFDLMFQLTNDDGGKVGEPDRQQDASARGNLQMAYGLDFFGVGWSSDDGSGRLHTRLSMYDSSGQIGLNPPVPGPTGFGLVTDVTWMDPQYFGVAWQDTGGGKRIIGVTRINTRGQAEPYALPDDSRGSVQALAIAGNTSLLGAFYTFDPEPQPGRLSPSTEVLFGVVGQCAD